MPPKSKAAAGGAKKGKASKGHTLAEQFPAGEVLRDLIKKKWVIGDVIGQGGFGLIYLASKEDEVKTGAAAEYVIKIEPSGNGPLFCEVHFYMKVAKPDIIDGWIKSHKLKYLGVPKYIASGLHNYKGADYRFMVMQRFGTDLQKIFETSGKRFSKQTVFALALRLIDALQYLHENDYIHADIKASNCLLGFKKGKPDTDVVYLVDFGLANKYQTDGRHKEYKEDPRKAHDGTVEFTSIDAHKGVAPSRRGDMEILGYCLLQWLCSTLPWEDKLGNKDYVRDSKIRYMADIPSLMKKCFPKESVPEEITTYLTAVKKLKYEERPNYDKLRDVFTKGLSKLGVKDTWKLALPSPGARPRSPSPKKSTKTPVKQTDRPVSGTNTKPGRPGTLGTPKGGSRSATPKGGSRPATPRSAASPTPGTSGQGAKKPSTAKGTKPSNKTGNAIVPGRARTKTTGTARQAKSPVNSPQSTNGVAKRMTSPGGSPAPKKRKVVRKRNAHLVESACQTSPSLKKNV